MSGNAEGILAKEGSMWIQCKDCGADEVLEPATASLRRLGLHPWRCPNCGLRPAMRKEKEGWVKTGMEEMA